tara:strand:- start:482 stop:730 length:249 start_codon:yes stop_codon:yes gene_type:complete
MDKPTLLTEDEVSRGLAFLNTLYNAAIATMPNGLVAAAREAQLKGLQEAGQGIVDLIEAHGPLAEKRAEALKEALVAPPEDQ